jgi:5-dehydro-2-deoxygluconokinase
MVWTNNTSAAHAEAVLDLVCIGRAAVDLYAEQAGCGLEEATSFAKYLGGSPANTAYGGARLGLRTAMLSRVGDEQHGRFVRHTLAAAGVDVSALHTDAQRLTGLAFLALRDRDTFPLLFYRHDCADLALAPEDVPEALIRRTRAVLLSGTHLSREGSCATSVHAATLARRHGARVVLDIDYRPVLWGLTGLGEGERRFVVADEVTRRVQAVLPLCDLIVGTEEEFHLAGGCTDTLAALRAVRACGAATLVLKRGAAGCVVFEGELPERLEEGIAGPGFAVEVFNVLGAGDAFMAGFLRGWLRGEALSRCCQWANAGGALVVSRHGCAPAMPSWEELQWFLAQAQAGQLPRALWQHAPLAQLHHSTTRAQAWPPLAVLALDHRSQLEALAREAGVPPAEQGQRISHFKQLAHHALLATPAPAGMARGMLLDDRYGADTLPEATAAGWWLARPVEAPGSLPLRWDFDEALALVLRRWPLSHVAKCLVFFHVAQEVAMKAVQIERLHELQATCAASGREWLLEVIAPSEFGPARTADAVAELYAAGLKPDWWKLPPAADVAEWQNTLAVIHAHDPHCRGAVVLGLDRPLPQLATAFAACPAGVRGFMVGRSIFGATARAWLAGEIDDHQAQAQLQQRYVEVGQAWLDSRAVHGLAPTATTPTDHTPSEHA